MYVLDGAQASAVVAAPSAWRLPTVVQHRKPLPLEPGDQRGIARDGLVALPPLRDGKGFEDERRGRGGEERFDVRDEEGACAGCDGA